MVKCFNFGIKDKRLFYVVKIIEILWIKGIYFLVEVNFVKSKFVFFLKKDE